MTLTHYIGGKLVGQTVDEFPSLNYPNLTTFINSETLIEYILVNGTWERVSFNPTVFPSMYESFQPLTDPVLKQHFVEWFSGKDLDSIWTKLNATGTGTFTMEDEIDGGFSVIAQSGGFNKSSIMFNDKRHYDNANSTVITVAKFSPTGTNNSGLVGLSGNGFDGATPQAYMGKLNINDTANFGTSTSDGAVTNNTGGSVPQDTNYHTFKGVLDGTDYKMFVDGVLDVITTVRLPTSKMQPTVLSLDNNVSNPPKITVRYFEVYNT